MSHLHVPDGVLPPAWIISGLIVTIFFLYLVANRVKRQGQSIALLGVVSAFLLLVMSVPLGIIPYHLSLASLAGILLGSELGFIAVFLVTFMLALLGHGGVTVIGLNTLTMAGQTVLASYLYRLLKKKLPVPWAVAVTTAVGIAVSTLLVIGIIWGSQVNPALFLHHGQEHEVAETVEAVPQISMVRFLALTLPVATAGGLIESVFVFLLALYLYRLRPNLFERESKS